MPAAPDTCPCPISSDDAPTPGVAELGQAIATTSMVAMPPPISPNASFVRMVCLPSFLSVRTLRSSSRLGVGGRCQSGDRDGVRLATTGNGGLLSQTKVRRIAPVPGVRLGGREPAG